MAPAVASASLLFHPKKNHKRTTPLPDRKAPSSTPPAARPPSQQQRRSTTTTEAPDEDAVLELPDVPFQEFRLMSSALNGWRYDVMKFDSRKPVDISTWQAPIKLNRKELRRDDDTELAAPVAIAPMLGPDGKPVIGTNGKVVMVDAEGRPIHPGPGLGGNGFNSNNSSGRDTKTRQNTNGRKKFQKKTRQVFLVPESTRQLRREERYPWVMEDASQREVWVGKLEEVSKSETHAFFMPAANDVFKFVPAHRWYKFQKKPNYHIPTLEEAESIMAKHQKNKDPERWLLHNRNGRGPSAATAAVFRAESEGRGLPGADAPQSLGPGGRKLKTVDSGMDGLFDEEEDKPTRRKKRHAGEGDMDEMEYEEDFADDEEKVDDDNDDEEAKELEDRLKREYKNANKQREGYVDESESEDEGHLTRDGKAMKKLIRNLEKNTAYDSDDEKNPYASSEAEEEEDPAPAKDTAQGSLPMQTPSSRSGSQTPKPHLVTPPGRGQPASTIVPTSGSASGSRATSPAPSNVAAATVTTGMGGHSVVAKRATSPKLRIGGGTSGVGAGAGAKLALATTITSQKRKASEDGGIVGMNNMVTTPKAKKRKAGPTGGMTGVPVSELEDRMVIDWLRNAPNASTRDCIQHFTPYLTDEAKKSKFTALVKEVAQLKGGVLVLRNAYRSTSL